MAKQISFKNTTLIGIELTELGETVPVNQGSPEQILDMSNTPAVVFRKVANLESLIVNGDIVVFDGTNDLGSVDGYHYLVDDVVADVDGFWHSNRRRFNLKINYPAHGFIVGEVIYIDINGSLQKAIATSNATSSTAYIVSEIVDVDNLYGGNAGTIVTPDASSIVEGLPLTVGAPYFLSASQAGKLTLTPPSNAGDIVKIIGVAGSTTELGIFNYPGYENGTQMSSAEITTTQSGTAISNRLLGWLPAVLDVVADPSTLTPLAGDRYIVGAGTGVWLGKDNNIAEYNSTTSSWYYTISKNGNFSYDKSLEKLIKFDGSIWSVAITGSTIGPPAICHRHNGSITQTFTSSFSTIKIGTDIKTDTSHYIVNNDEVEVLASGWYRVEYDVSADAVNNSRSSMEHRLEINSAEIEGSQAFSYHRTSSAGEDTAHASIWINLSMNDKIRIRSKELTGSTKTKSHSCRLTLEYYG